MFHCKNSVRDTVIDKRWIYLDSERSTLHRVWAFAEANSVAMDVVWLGFVSWVNSYLVSGGIIPTTGEQPTPLSFDSLPCNCPATSGCVI